MKKIIVGIAILSLLCSCGNKKGRIDPSVSTASKTDSADLGVTGYQDDKTEKVFPTEADDSFDDFIYTFASDDALQRQRILFPLPCYEGDNITKIEEDEWKHDHFFLEQNFYTLLFEREEDMDLIGNDTLTSAQMEWILLPKRTIKKYHFERADGAWMLKSIRLQPITNTEKEEFVAFYERFSTDSVFQSKRVRQPLQFVTVDPDDDFSVIETTLDAYQWVAFKPTLPTDKLSNINYGQKDDGESPYTILALKGVGNGFSNILYFQRKTNGDWELYKFEDTSI